MLPTRPMTVDASWVTVIERCKFGEGYRLGGCANFALKRARGSMHNNEIEYDSEPPVKPKTKNTTLRVKPGHHW